MHMTVLVAMINHHYCEMILRAVSDSTPPDLTVSLALTGGKL